MGKRKMPEADVLRILKNAREHAVIQKHLQPVETTRRHLEVLLGLAFRDGVRFGRKNPKDDARTEQLLKYRGEMLANLFLDKHSIKEFVSDLLQ